MSTEWIMLPEPDPVSLLLEKIPEFRDHLDENDRNLPYVAFGFFAQYLMSLPPTNPIFIRGIELLNTLANSGSTEMENLVQVSVLELLADNPDVARTVGPLLNGNALRLLDEAQA